ncbi:hypothetical protein BT69DRAFT_1240284 [Atractiella rhizophila]|nr:hypothetical protein BT69DRAFT_1240284 [Atractiella rhizophila]
MRLTLCLRKAIPLKDFMKMSSQPAKRPSPPSLSPQKRTRLLPASPSTSTTTSTTTSSASKSRSKKEKEAQPIDSLTLSFLGTSAGKPSVQRNVSCLVMKAAGKAWVFDVGEGSQRQFMRSRGEAQVRLGAVRKVFVSHLHGDHVLGLAPLLLSIPKPENADGEVPTVQIYGLPGLRALLRLTFRLTWNFPECRFQVNELHSRHVRHKNFRAGELEALGHPDSLVYNEVRGENIECSDPDGRIWRDICIDETLSVDAGTILHRVPCVGYVVKEAPRRQKFDIDSLKPVLERNRNALLEQKGIKNPLILLGQLQRDRIPIELPDGTVLQPPALDRPGRKLTILGDTFDANNIVSIAHDSSVLVHECTNAYIPRLDVDTNAEEVRKKAKDHGHSTPEVAGALAKAIDAKMLLLNHLSPRYKLDSEEEDDDISKEIARQASVAWGGGEAITTRDFFTVSIPLPS